MDENSQDKGKKDEENDEDNMGRDEYFRMDRDNDLSSLESQSKDDEDSRNTIPNLGNYINNEINTDINNIVENPPINLDATIINNKIDDNINMIDDSINNNMNNKNVNNINNVSNKTIINNITSNSMSESITDKKYNEDEMTFPNLDKNKDILSQNNINKNEIENPNPKKNEIPEKISLSSSGEDDEEIKIIPDDQFKRHFQEERYGPERRIEIIDPNKNNNILSPSNFKEILKKKNNNIDKEKIFDNFFSDKIKDKKMEVIPKKNNKINFNKNKNKNFNNIKTKEFIPMPKDDFKANTYFKKLLINRVEHQILTDIYNSYDEEDKLKFEQTNYYISELKKLITYHGVDKAIQFLNNIEPMELRTKIAIESTYFFKEVVREEVENARVNNGELILIKQPEILYKQSLQNLSGKINYHGKSSKRRGNSMRRYDHSNFTMNNLQRNECNNINKNNIGEIQEYNNNNININPYVLKGQNILNQKRKNFYNAFEQ